jgi:hypothetical protein
LIKIEHCSIGVQLNDGNLKARLPQDKKNCAECNGLDFMASEF